MAVGGDNVGYWAVMGGFGIISIWRSRSGILAELLRLIYGNTSSKNGHCALFITLHAGS